MQDCLNLSKVDLVRMTLPFSYGRSSVFINSHLLEF